jgi:hypothetical protein
MLTTELSSHSDLLSACGKTSHNDRAVKPTIGPQNLFPRDYRPTSLQRPSRQQSLPVSEIGFVSKFSKPPGRRLFSRAKHAQICTKSPIGFVFSVHGPSVLHAQTCTNLHKAGRAGYPANSNNNQPVIKNWLRSAKNARPASSGLDACSAACEPPLSYRASWRTPSIRPEIGPCFDELFEI